MFSCQIRWFYKREVDKDWTPFMGYDSLRIELRYRHIWQTKWSEADRRTNTFEVMRGRSPNANGGASRRARSLNRTHFNGYEDDMSEYPEQHSVTFRDDYNTTPYYSSSPATSRASGSLPGGGVGPPGGRMGGRGRQQFRPSSADNFSEEDRDMHIIVRGGVYEVDLAEWKCHSLYWPGEAFDIMRGTWFYEHSWQPVQCEYADRIEQEHLQRFLGHKMADYVWDHQTSTRLEKQVSYYESSIPNNNDICHRANIIKGGIHTANGCCGL